MILCIYERKYGRFCSEDRARSRGYQDHEINRRVTDNGLRLFIVVRNSLIQILLVSLVWVTEGDPFFAFYFAEDQATVV